MDSLLAFWSGLGVLIAINGLITDSKLIKTDLENAKSGVASIPKNVDPIKHSGLKVAWRTFTGCVYVFDNITLFAIELSLPMIALIFKVGNPIAAYICLAVWLVGSAYGTIRLIRESRAQRKAKATNTPYEVKPVSTLFKVFAFIPDVYALYIFLIATRLIK